MTLTSNPADSIVSSWTRFFHVVAFLMLFLTFSAPDARAQTLQPLKVGDRVEVLSGGQWYPAVVIEIGTDGPYAGLPVVHYDGYGSEFDEYVNLNRVRSAPSDLGSNLTERKQFASTEANPEGGQSPVGRYLCQAFEAGLLHTQGEFVLQAGGTYRELMYEENGTWTYDPGTRSLTFTGVLDNGGRATFYPEMYRGRRRNGVVAFEWDKDIIRECYRSNKGQESSESK